MSDWFEKQPIRDVSCYLATSQPENCGLSKLSAKKELTAWYESSLEEHIYKYTTNLAIAFSFPPITFFVEYEDFGMFLRKKPRQQSESVVSACSRRSAYVEKRGKAPSLENYDDIVTSKISSAAMSSVQLLLPLGWKMVSLFPFDHRARSKIKPFLPFTLFFFSLLVKRD